jgi:hypothetical protein
MIMAAFEDVMFIILLRMLLFGMTTMKVVSFGYLSQKDAHQGLKNVLFVSNLGSLHRLCKLV